MTLREQQELLARLYVDSSFRSKFLGNATVSGEALGIDPSEARELAVAAEEEVRWFAESLVTKRLRGVEKLLSMTKQELGAKEFERQFRLFAETFSPVSVKKRLEDALAFAKHLRSERSLEPVERNIVRFESCRLRHNSHGRGISFCFLRFEPGNLRRGFGLWVAIGSWSRAFFRPQASRRR